MFDNVSCFLDILHGDGEWYSSTSIVEACQRERGSRPLQLSHGEAFLCIYVTSFIDCLPLFSTPIMIRSNPTAIPLRATDVKILQVELERRKVADKSSTEQTATEQTNARKVKDVNYDAVNDAKQDRQQKSARERIGL